MSCRAVSVALWEMEEADVMKNVKKSRGYSPALLQHLIDFPLDVPYAPVHGRLGHIELALDLDNGVCPDAQVEHGPLIVGEIALPAEVFAFRSCKICFNIHGYMITENKAEKWLINGLVLG